MPSTVEAIQEMADKMQTIYQSGVELIWAGLCYLAMTVFIIGCIFGVVMYIVEIWR